MAEFYDWGKTLAYDADVTMVVGARGIGKTFGLRKQCVKDWIKDGSTFVETTRFKNELADVADGYFNRLAELPEFFNYEFRTDARYGYIANKDEVASNGKPIWHLICYFVALNEGQKKKKKTFNKVRRIIFDEAILDNDDIYHNYLRNEFMKLADLVDTVSRERADTESIRPRVYLLGNALDIKNPYFAHYRVSTKLEYGYRWYKNKTFLLHYVRDDEYSKEKRSGTVAGRMLEGTTAGNISVNNEFMLANDEFVQRKPANAKYMFGIVCNSHKFGIWCDYEEGCYCVSNKIPKGATNPIYSLTRADYSANYMAAKRADPVMKTLIDFWYLGLITYDTVQLKVDFAEVLELYGVR